MPVKKCGLPQKISALKNAQRLDKGDWTDYNVAKLNKSSEKNYSETKRGENLCL